MMPDKYEIYEAHVRFGKATYPRPCVVIDVIGTECCVIPISSAMELYLGPPMHFRIEPTDPDFAETGLKKECYVSSHPIQYIGFDKLIRRRGRFKGDLLKRFDK